MVSVRWILLAISLSISVLALPALAEQPSRAYVVGLLFTGAGLDDPLVHAITKGLSDLGYVNGRDFRFEFRGAQGQLDRLQHLAEELVQLNVDVIVVATEAALRAAKQSSATIAEQSVAPEVQASLRYAACKPVTCARLGLAR